MRHSRGYRTDADDPGGPIQIDSLSRAGSRPYDPGMRPKRLPRYLADRYAERAERRRPRHRPRRIAVNIGTGGVDLAGWINLDETKPGDVIARVPPLPLRTGRVDELMLSHVLEHLTFDDGNVLLQECRRVLKQGGEMTVIVPDMKAVNVAYLTGQISNRELNDLFVHSYVQESLHRWSYDWRTLRQALIDSGFPEIRRINRFNDPRLFAPAWYQVACVATRTD